MIKKVISLGLLGLLSIAAYDIASNSAPASSTGAPGEVNCTVSGCHSDNTLNSGGGIPCLIVENGLTEYVTGTTYNITVGINHTNLIRFGFQLIALRDTDSSNAGTLVVTNPARTQTISGFANLINRKYMTYTYPGTDSVSQGKGQWSFQWTAPSTDVGPITLYLATIAANNDGTDAGDYCYLKSLKLSVSPIGIHELNLNTIFKVFPNPVTDKININFNLEKESNLKFELYDAKGAKLKDWNMGVLCSGLQYYSLNLNPDYQNGTYFLKCITNTNTVVKKITINSN